jgi:hypothetical protein
MKLSFSRGKDNGKLYKLEEVIGGEVWTFSVLSGHTCPYAKTCHSRVEEYTDDSGKVRKRLIDGEHTLTRCFSASQEALYPSLYASRKANTAVIALADTSVQLAAEALLVNLPKRRNLRAIRVHVGGDFKTQSYFDAWLEVARQRPDLTFYAYTKSLPFLVRRIEEIPTNFVFTASYGGWKDRMIDEYSLRFARIVFTGEQAELLGLEIDHDDSHAIVNGASFALLLHGVQPKGSEAAEALKQLKKQGIGSYSRKQKVA